MTEERIRVLGNRICDMMDELKNICQELQMSIHVDPTWHSKYNDVSTDVFIHSAGNCFYTQNREELIDILIDNKK